MYRWLLTASLARPRATIAAWLVIVLISGLVATDGLGNIHERGFTVPGSETARANEILSRYIPGNTGTRIEAVLIAHRPTPSRQWTQAGESAVVHERESDLENAIRPLRRIPDLASIERGATESEPVEDAREEGALVTIVRIRIGLSYAAAEDRVPEIEKVLQRASASYVSFGLVGGVIISRRYSLAARHDLEHAERVALPFVFAALCIAFLSVAAAALPVVLAVITLATTLALLDLASLRIGLSIFVLNTASAVALGLSIDYALIVVTRFREERHAVSSIYDAIERTMETAGRAVLLSGLTIALSLAPLMAVGIGLFSSIALGGIIASLVAVLASLTLLPAAIYLLGDRLDRFTLRPFAEAARRATFSRWVARTATTHPIVVALMSLAVLLSLAAPSLGLRIDFRNLSGLSSSDPMVQQINRISNVFGPGATGLVEIVTKEPERVAAVVRSEPSNTIWRQFKGRNGWYAIDVVLKTSPESNASQHTVSRFRRELQNGKGTTQIGGITAEGIDLTSRVASLTPIVVAITMLLGFIVLAAGLRSIVVPLKAVFCSALSVAATLGVLIVLFPSSSPGSRLAFFVPPVIFVLVFGLSVDYEVFLVSRIRESVRAGHPMKTAVSFGLLRSARSITLAAFTVAIVFAALALSSLESIRQLGIGVAIAIALDVTIVRCMLVPACMVLLGRWNWWFPTSKTTRLIAVWQEESSGSRGGSGHAGYDVHV